MRSERVYSLARELMSKPASFANTLSDQWAERTLDDSAIRSKLLLCSLFRLLEMLEVIIVSKLLSARVLPMTWISTSRILNIAIANLLGRD